MSAVYTARTEGSLHDGLDWELFHAERSDEKKSSREKYPSLIRSDSHGSFASLSRYCIRKQLHAEAPSLRKMKL